MTERLFASKEEMIDHFLKDGKPNPKLLTRWQIFKAKIGREVSLGNFLLPGHSAPMVYFLFKCVRCGELSIDYRHGYRRLYCHHHNTAKDLNELFSTPILD